MPGMYDRIDGTGDKIPVHLLRSFLQMYALGIANAAQLRTAMDNWLTNDGQSVLQPDDLTDLTAMAAAIDAASGANGKARYLTELEALAIAVEMGVAEVTETVFRNNLGL